jgi:type IV secretory pathway TrbD component
MWLAALAFCWLPMLPLFLLGIIVLMAASTQEQCEPRAMLLATADDARSLLRTKVWGAVRLMTLVLMPVLVAATLFQPGWWWVHAGFGLGMLVLVAYAVVLKYANYRPNMRLEANGANVSVAALFAILPGLGVVPLVMLLTEWPKARQNLNACFHDHHH